MFSIDKMLTENFQILSLSLTLAGCLSACGNSGMAEQIHAQQGATGAQVFFREFDSTSIADLNEDALRSANDLHLVLGAEQTAKLQEELTSLSCAEPRTSMSLDLRLLVLFDYAPGLEKWEFSRFLYQRPDGHVCTLSDEDRKNLTSTLHKLGESGNHKN